MHYNGLFGLRLADRRCFWQLLWTIDLLEEEDISGTRSDVIVVEAENLIARHKQKLDLSLSLSLDLWRGCGYAADFRHRERQTN